MIAGALGFAVVTGCGKGAGAPATSVSAPTSSAARVEDESEPLPEAGDPCKTEGKRRQIVCEPSARRCALLVCTKLMWMYEEEELGDGGTSK